MNLSSFLKMKKNRVLLKCILSDHPANVQLRRALVIHYDQLWYLQKKTLLLVRSKEYQHLRRQKQVSLSGSTLMLWFPSAPLASNFKQIRRNDRLIMATNQQTPPSPKKTIPQTNKKSKVVKTYLLSNSV